eukprot:CAMPEP_0202073152 /NCGR_PEP_ID=MMETSP0964-20121228/2862_1 /ASSEMBLY_ACC=CAM_ASM_000500 /TAXON_ID=4773 /ORGANISM="Schizochytrium aggregatum, Strain ATCC28209" /LENGTH=534 /DNA_ID=CAMNT_0048640235 /DNA_START=1 /DNA_END=1605 /DNA_ORIENTATION=+
MRPRWVFFGGFAALATQGRFMSLFLEDMGLDAAEVGEALALPALLNVLAPLLWGWLADRYLGRAAALVTAAVLGCVVYLLLAFPEMRRFNSVLFIRTTQSICMAGIPPLMDAYCLDYLKARPIESASGEGEDDSTAARKALYGRERLFGAISWAIAHLVLGFLFDSYSYYIMLPASFITTIGLVVFVVVSHGCSGSVVRDYTELADEDHAKAAIEMVRPTPQARGDFEPLPASFSAAGPSRSAAEADMTAESAALSRHRTPLNADEDEDEDFVAVAPPPGRSHAAASADGGHHQAHQQLNPAAVPSEDPMHSSTLGVAEAASGVAAQPASACQDLLPFFGGLFTNVYSVVFLLTVFIISNGTALVEGLVFIFFRDELGASNVLMGLSVVITVSMEIPLFALAPALLRRFGANILMVFGLWAYGLRAIAYTYITPDSPWLLLVVEPLHGVTFTMIQLSSVLQITALAPDKYEAVAQGFLNSVRALGVASGSLFGSQMLDKYGPLITYRFSGAVVLVTSLVYYVALVCARPARVEA